MKIKVLQENLQKVLSVVQKAVPSRPPLPILSSINIVVTESTCTLAATDLYFGITSQVQAEVEESGSIVVLGKQFYEIISSLPPGPLTLDFSEGTLTIRSQKTKSSLQCQESEEYPEFPIIEADAYDISGEQLQRINQMVGFSASSDLARPVYTSIYCHSDEKGATFVSTDGFRLATLSMKEVFSPPLSSPLLIPAKALMEVQKIMGLLSVDVLRLTVSHELKQIVCTLADTRVFVRLIDGEFPPYERIIPPASTIEVVCGAQELLSNIKRAMVFAREASNIIRLKCDEKGLTVLATSASLGTYEGEVNDSTTSGGSIEIAFNARYVLEYIQSISSEKMSIHMTESLKPAIFTNDEEKGQRYIIMPFKVSG